MNKFMMTMAAALLASGAMAARSNAPVQAMRGNEGGPETSGLEAKLTIDQYPRIGKQCLLAAPRLEGGSTLGRCYTKPRSWIVLESKYTTFAKSLEQLTFTWHVVLDVRSATNKDREGQKKRAPYTYFTTSVTYQNIPRGSHAASVCLHPSYLEVYGEPCAVALVVSNQNGDILGGDTVGIAPFNPQKKKAGYKFWEDTRIMDARDAKTGIPMVERRQGLQDRSKTIWALVNPDDYELVAQ